MKKQNNKGFTLVELVIVIAVIAILAGVLIGTFASVIARANQSKALQVAKAAFDETWVEFIADEHEIPTWITVDENGVKLYNDKNTFTAEDSVVVTGFDVEIALDATAVKVEAGKTVKIAEATTGYAVAVRFSADGYEVVLVKTEPSPFDAATGKKITLTAAAPAPEPEPEP